MTSSNMFCKTIVSVFLIFVVRVCSSCIEHELSLTQLTVPLINATQDKRFYLGVYFKTNWRGANQFCLQHGMKLATIESQEENSKLERVIRDLVVRVCSSCIEHELSLTQLTVPLINATQDKRFYLGVYFKTNWRGANQFCLQHGMKLATIESQEENSKLERVIRDLGHNDEFFFTSGTDLAQEGQFFWMTSGRPVVYTNWAPGEPSDLKQHRSIENCLAVINAGNSALQWHDLQCIYQKYFICEIRSKTC